MTALHFGKNNIARNSAFDTRSPAPRYRGGSRIERICQPDLDGLKELREISEESRAPFVR